MPIVYVHGVNVRDRKGFQAIMPLLRRYVAPVLSARPTEVEIQDVFWGDEGVTFAWDGASRPRSQLIGMGAAGVAPNRLSAALTAALNADALARLPEPTAPAPPPASGGLAASGSGRQPAAAEPLRPRDLDPDSLSILLQAAIVAADSEPSGERTRRIMAADAVALDPATPPALAAAATVEDEIGVLLERIRAASAAAPGGLAGMGGDGYWTRLGDTLSETARRALGLPTYALSVVAAEMRKPLNDLVSVFLGDVFVYLRTRGDSAVPGRIPQRLLAALQKASADSRAKDDEPLVVLTHSMGGQLVYDAVSHFLPKNPALADVRIDFWCATASQVGFFEEAKLMLASDPAYRMGNPVPFPSANLGKWWNVWDPNDFLSFTARGIVAGVDDESYSSGMPLVTAHGGYLDRPSFYRRFAEKLEAAKAKGWRRP